MEEDYKQFYGLISLRQVEAVDEILEKQKLNVNKKDKYGFYPVRIAATRCDLEMLQLLVKYGAKKSLSKKDYFGRNLLDLSHHCQNQKLTAYIQQELTK